MQTTGNTVLLIDDHEDTRGLLSELLELEGHQVVVASNGSEALAAMSRLEPCMILIDLGLPDVSGIDLATSLRNLPAVARVPMYALSGSHHLRPQALAAGCDGFLLKPVLPFELRQLVNQHCPKTPRADKVA